MKTDAQKAAGRRYYERNKCKVMERNAVWRQNNRERYNQMHRDRRQIDPEVARKRARGYALKRKYGITLDQYDELLAKQNHCCAICERPAKDFPTSLAVDHDHKTGRIRGLLCTHCNYRMVAKHTDGSLLRKIADYIEQGTDWFVPPKPKKKKKRKAKDVRTEDSSS